MLKIRKEVFYDKELYHAQKLASFEIHLFSGWPPIDFYRQIIKTQTTNYRKRWEYLDQKNLPKWKNDSRPWNLRSRSIKKNEITNLIIHLEVSQGKGTEEKY